MFGSSDQPENSNDNPPDGKQVFFAYMKTVSLILVALIVVGLLVYPTFFFPAIDYANLPTKISALNTPERVKKILLFFVEYNVFLLLCALFGASVGASEILSRYRDEPFIAISSPPGRRYLAVNAGISLAAFYLLYHFRGSIFPDLVNDPLMMSIVAGFGAMIVMRSKIFNFKTESGESYAIGPDAVLSIFLTSVDRQIDRYRASRRQSLVYEETQNVEHPITAPDFLRSFLVSYQNLSNKERLDIDEEVKKIYNQTDLRSPRLKFMTAAFGFLNLMGENNFRALVQQLKKYQKLAPDVQQSVAGANASPVVAVPDSGAGATLPQPPPVVAKSPATPSAPTALNQIEESAGPVVSDAASTAPVETAKAEISPATEGPSNSGNSLSPASLDTSGNLLPAKPADVVAASEPTKTGEIAESSEVEEAAGEGASETKIVKDSESGGTGDDSGQG